MSSLSTNITGADPTAEPAPVEDRRIRARRLTLVLIVLLLVVSGLSLTTGASGASLWNALSDLVAGRELSTMDRVVLLDIRLPRLCMGILVGASLAVSGAVMQGLFRNPLADPGIVGVSAGAGLAAITAIVIGGMLPLAVQQFLGSWIVPVAAFFGGWGSTLLLYRVSTRGGHTSVATITLMEEHIFKQFLTV